MTINSYEIRVRVVTLADASRAITALSEIGFHDVELSPIRTGWEQEHASLGRYNRLILTALDELGATSRETAVTAEQIVAQLRQKRELEPLLRRKPEGVYLRTVGMVASAVLGSKYGWVTHVEEQTPTGTNRRFWLTSQGAEEARGALREATAK